MRRAIWDALARVGATGMHALPVSRRWLEIHRRPMPLRGLASPLEGLRLVQLSDLHYSPVVWRTYLEQQIDIVNELSPDLVVITGDLITGGYRYARRVATLLRRLSARRGVVVTFGNHDYSMWGRQMPEQARRRGDYLERMIEDEGIIVLRNEVLRVGPQSLTQHRPGETPPPEPTGELVLVGLDDEWTGRIDPAAAFSLVHPLEPVVCLNHNPANARSLLRYPWQWMLCGHTHGRQLGHKGWSKALLASKRRPFTHGYYPVEDRHLYVNRGLSYGQRVHEWCRPEVTVFRTAVAPGREAAESGASGPRGAGPTGDAAARPSTTG
ncbi:MAG: metallophosphoesterase [Tepidisphaerales bacterium]